MAIYIYGLMARRARRNVSTYTGRTDTSGEDAIKVTEEIVNTAESRVKTVIDEYLPSTTNAIRRIKDHMSQYRRLQSTADVMKEARGKLDRMGDLAKQAATAETDEQASGIVAEYRQLADEVNLTKGGKLGGGPAGDDGQAGSDLGFSGDIAAAIADTNTARQNLREQLAMVEEKLQAVENELQELTGDQEPITSTNKAFEAVAELLRQIQESKDDADAQGLLQQLQEAQANANQQGLPDQVQEFMDTQANVDPAMAAMLLA